MEIHTQQSIKGQISGPSSALNISINLLDSKITSVTLKMDKPGVSILTAKEALDLLSFLKQNESLLHDQEEK